MFAAAVKMELHRNGAHREVGGPHRAVTSQLICHIAYTHTHNSLFRAITYMLRMYIATRQRPGTCCACAQQSTQPKGANGRWGGAYWTRGTYALCENMPAPMIATRKGTVFSRSALNLGSNRSIARHYPTQGAKEQTEGSKDVYTMLSERTSYCSRQESWPSFSPMTIYDCV